MTGTEPHDREPAAQAGPAYRDRWGVVSEGRQMSRPALLAAVVAVCGTGLLAGVGLFGGSTPKPRPAAPAAAVVQNAAQPGSHSGGPIHARPLHRRHTAHHPPAHLPRLDPVPHRSHDTTHPRHKGSTGPGAPHSAGRHSPVRGRLRKSGPESVPQSAATARPEATSETPRPAARPMSAAPDSAASR